MNAVIEANSLGKRYGHKWALSQCTLAIPAGKVVGLVGPNGAGKTTLLQLSVGLLRPSAGSISVLGGEPGATPAQLARVGFVAQDTPIYAGFSVADHLRFGRWMNPSWDARLAEAEKKKKSKLSGGQRAQLALTLAVAKRPELLVLDEPVASLDPLARREFLQSLIEVVVDCGASVVLSSHLVADLERVCDYLVVLVGSRLQIAGEIDELLASHHRLSGPRHRARRTPGRSAGHRGEPYRRAEHARRADRPARPRCDMVGRPTRARRPRPFIHDQRRERGTPAEAGGSVVIRLEVRS